jgi:hypothetical protein
MPFEHDHHSQMLEELGIKDDTQFPNFVRVEITPVDGDIFNHNLDNWKLRVDQDFRPDWFDVDKAEKECKIKMQEWFEKCFAIDSQEWKEFRNTRIYVRNAKVEAWENSSVVAWGNSSVEAWENSSVVARGNSSVEARENSSVVARENSSVVAWGNSQILIPYSTTIIIKDIQGNATVKDLSGEKPKIYVANDFEIVKFGK